MAISCVSPFVLGSFPALDFAENTFDLSTLGMLHNAAMERIQTHDIYVQQYSEAKEKPSSFWLDVAEEKILWMQAPSLGLEGDFRSVKSEAIRWFSDGILNVTESCLDRHVLNHPDKIAIIWEGDEVGDQEEISYQSLADEVNRLANTLKAQGVKKGDRVIIYMGMVPQAAVTMLACARIGAIHSVVFGGFSADALRDRVIDCEATAIISQDFGKRGGRDIELKNVVDQALIGTDSVNTVIVYQRSPERSEEIRMHAGRDHWWHELVAKSSNRCAPEPMQAEDPLFILYTSGSTGKPKGMVHTSGGYLTYAAYTHETVFGLKDDDVYACVADVGWITGHSYIVYGPLANGATTLMFESTPLYPDAGRYWGLVERHKINIFYTAPTAIRAVMAHGNEFVQKYDRSSLRVLGTVGEPINPEAWQWYHDVVGDKRCSVVDTWWQTETGGICIAPIAGVTQVKAGAATLPLPGIVPSIVDTEGESLQGAHQGHLCLEQPWPGQARTVWRDHTRFFETYFQTYPGRYFTGDGCRRDDDGHYWITGRVDDVLNVSGHRMGTAEFESVILCEDSVAETAVVGCPHPIKGQGVYAYVVMNVGHTWNEKVAGQLKARVKKSIGAHAHVDHYQVIPALPKTRSGKVMRRILRKIAEGNSEHIGDISTLADSRVVKTIQDGFQPLA